MNCHPATLLAPLLLAAAPLAAEEPTTPTAPPAVVAPVPLTPPVAPFPPLPPGRRRSGSFLGVEVTKVPIALSDQLNLPEGYGVLVDYVVPGSPAEMAGVKSHDVLKLMNDQIVTSADHLAVLVRNLNEGQEVTLTVLRKGQETKLTAKVDKRTARDSDRRRSDWPGGADEAFNFDFSNLPDPAMAEKLRAELERSREQIRMSAERAMEQSRRSLDDARREMARSIASRVEYDRAHITLRDASGRIELRIADGSKRLRLRDGDGRKIFEGAIDTPEQRKAIPADLLPQVEALEREQVTSFPDEDRAERDREKAERERDKAERYHEKAERDREKAETGGNRAS